ncbi:hypothetical protein McpAg1_01830 [Methanocorpusculaceae archaeon Ag1]|uniref:Signal peptidase I n=2 Tax=Methanorbis furvi TaxID=3028299 RepID=A0AAE4S9I8_9EURY|nr:hypothetical protein [Methanocorpusculaceae archaeon Ag1]
MRIVGQAATKIQRPRGKRNFYTGEDLVRYSIMSSKPSLLEKLKSDDPKISLVRDILSVIIIVAVIGAVLFGVSGTWPAIVAVESGSMVPNMNVGDLIFVVEENRFGPLMTSLEAQAANVTSFGGYGDVIIYQPNGNSQVTPIIHRALGEINESTALEAGLANGGYITKGDHNPTIDQGNIFTSVGMMQPVKDEWVVGKALFAIPLVGYLPLHIWEFAVVVIIILIAWELYSRRKEKAKEDAKKSQKKGKK